MQYIVFTRDTVKLELWILFESIKEYIILIDKKVKLF
jgi:hypothetical protein